MRTIIWNDSSQQLEIIDQRVIPSELRYSVFRDHRQVCTAITEMVVRGAPAIGVAGAFGIVLAALNSPATTLDLLRSDLRIAAAELIASRPTAVNLSSLVNRMVDFSFAFSGNLEELKLALLEKAKSISDEDIQINLAMARFGAELIQNGDQIIHHCNTGALATVDYGTALGVIRMAHEQGKKIHVFVDETRPRLQGARLTAWELEQYGISYDIIVDGASGYFLRSGQVNKVLFGGDRMAANGDVANKIGTYNLALAAYDNSVPVYCVVPTSTIDYSIDSGNEIVIEEREEAEVLGILYQNQQVVPSSASARNPAFDVTPHRLLSAIVTEKGVIYPPYFRNLAELKKP